MALLVAENLVALTASVILHLEVEGRLMMACKDTHCDLRRPGSTDHEMRFVIL